MKNIVERIYTQRDNDGESVFVFGSNLSGLHGAGAALAAKQHWGAAQGCGVGRRGMSYAIPTKNWNVSDSLSVEQIKVHVEALLKYASDNPQLKFLVSKIGCGLAGFAENEIAPLWAGAPGNCELPDGWRTK